jgi:hypothetical protein
MHYNAVVRLANVENVNCSKGDESARYARQSLNTSSYPDFPSSVRLAGTVTHRH